MQLASGPAASADCAGRRNPSAAQLPPTDRDRPLSLRDDGDLARGRGRAPRRAVRETLPITVPPRLRRFGLLLTLSAGPTLLLAHQGPLYDAPHLVPLPPPVLPDRGPKDPPVPVVKI